jgi:hypothetical protein
MGDITDLEHDNAFDDEEDDEVPTTVKPRDAWWEYDERTNSLVIPAGETRVRVLTGPRNEVVIRCDEGDLVIAPQFANLIRVRVKL